MNLLERMKINFFKKKPLMTVVVNFYNNQREAKRTLYSLTHNYQNVSADLYQVLAIDNNSTEPLGEDFVKSFGPNFRYLFYKNDLPSPCKAINYGVKISKTPYVVICIDGARILSPGILKNMIYGIKLTQNPFIYTIGLHIGCKPQKYLIEEGYNQHVEDEIIKETNWEKNGYELFNISSIAPSSKNGYFSYINESNCFLLMAREFISVGGYDERFKSIGGGYSNIELFNRLNQIKRYQNIMLLGEATFHQFHGGVVTNASYKNRLPLLREMEKEYKLFVGDKIINSKVKPMYIGKVFPEYHKNLGIEFDENE